MGRSKLIKYIDKSTCKGLRDSFGMSQDDMAAYLNVSRSQLNMAERDQRNLPSEALRKSAELEKFILGGTGKPSLAENEKHSQSLNEQKKNLKVFATKKIHNYRYEEQKALRALEILQVKKQQCEDLLAVLPLMREKMLPEYETYYAKIERNAYNMHMKYGLDMEIKLEAQLAALRAEMKVLEEYYSQELHDELYPEFGEKKNAE